MKENNFIYLGIFGIILILIMINGYFTDKPKKKEGLTNMAEDTLASKSKTHLDKLTEKHEFLGNKVLASNPEYKNYLEFHLYILLLDKML